MAIKLKKINWRNINLPRGVSGNLFSVSSAIIKHGWDIEQYDEKIYKLILRKNGVQLSIYLSTMTVQTSMNHPRKGKTQLSRKNITVKEFERLLINPREHTGKGIYNDTKSTATTRQARRNT